MEVVRYFDDNFKGTVTIESIAELKQVATSIGIYVNSVWQAIAECDEKTNMYTLFSPHGESESPVRTTYAIRHQGKSITLQEAYKILDKMTCASAKQIP